MAPDASPATQEAATPMRYDYLDALRGWAFLGVLSVHAAALIGGRFAGANVALAGKYGVQLFFMVSAFTIFLTLERARWKGWRTCGEFFIRRFFRILPMFWVGLALYAFVPGRAAEYAAVKFTPLDYALTALLQHGWWPKLINSLVPGGWSIAVEGGFYLIAPLCFRFVKSWQAALWLVLGSLVLAEITRQGMTTLYFGGHLFAGQPRALVGEYLYCWLPMQLPVFACGILAYRLTQGLEKPARVRATGAALLAVAVGWIFTSIDIDRHGLVEEHEFFALGFLPLLLGLKIWPAAGVVNPVTRFLGKVSYSAYLLHFVVLHVAQNSLDTFLEPEWQTGLPAFALLFAFTLLGTAPLAWLAHRCVERPGIDLGAKLIRAWRARTDGAAPARENPVQPRPEAVPADGTGSPVMASAAE